MNYTPVIGMEVHIELKTKSKMFCSCPNDPDRQEPASPDGGQGGPNVNICEICLGHPGTLPVPNKKALAWTVLIGRALGCNIRELSKFDRKHYFYPDLPKGYQISQYDEPIAEDGQISLSFVLEDNIREAADIGIRRVHLEEDTAKLTHDGKNSTLIDFNRAGVPLVEIVTNPNFKTALEAKIYCQELQRLMRYLGVSDAEMEKGHLRCEANVSVQEAGRFEIVGGEVKPLEDYQLNHKVELKNINSFRAVEKAIQYEIDRQIELSNRGESWPQQTRGWDEDKGATVLQRVKENAPDYRYFPEPDIPPFHPAKIAGKIHLPELPIAKRQRFHEEYGFSYADAKILTETKAWADFAEAVMSELIEWITTQTPARDRTDETKEKKQQMLARLAGGWLTSKLLGAMSERKIDIRVLKLSPENFAELISLIYLNKINSSNALKLLHDLLDAGADADPTHIMEEKGYGQVSDEKKLAAVIEKVIKNYPAQVKQFRAGKEPVLKFLVGMVMKATEGSADPQVAEKLLRKKLPK